MQLFADPCMHDAKLDEAATCTSEDMLLSCIQPLWELGLIMDLSASLKNEAGAEADAGLALNRNAIDLKPCCEPYAYAHYSLP